MLDIIHHEVVRFMADIVHEMNNPWKVFGIFAQLLFMGRFIVQWLASEKAGYSMIPVAFWYFSLLGAVSLLIYGIHEREPVIIIGQSFPMIVYIRNLRLIYRAKKNLAQHALEETPVILR